MKVFPLVMILAALAVARPVFANPDEGASDESQPHEMALSFFPPGEQLELLARGAAKGAMLGIGLGGWADGAVEGLNVMSVSPGGPADLAGLRSGDRLTAFGGEALAADSGQESYEKLRELLAEIEPGSEVTVEYQRGEEQSEAMIVTGAWPQILSRRGGGDWRKGIAARAGEWTKMAKNWSGAGGNVEVQVDVEDEGEGAHRIVRIRRSPVNALNFMDMAWRLGGLQIAELTPALGEYFGTDHGLLVVSAPDDADVPLEDGDVIRKIGGRAFKDARHATRILRSYEPGEQVELEVLRHKRSKMVDFALPEQMRPENERMLRRWRRPAPPRPPAAH